MNRREFLRTSATGSAALATLSAAAANRPLIVDTHTHCFAGKADLRFPYHPRGT